MQKVELFEYLASSDNSAGEDSVDIECGGAAEKFDHHGIILLHCKADWVQ